MDGGVIAEEGTPQQIFEDPQNERTKDFQMCIRDRSHAENVQLVPCSFSD